jgi:hypothetical protein
MSVVSGPTVQPAPTDVAPRRYELGSTTVSGPIATPTSISVDATAADLDQRRRGIDDRHPGAPVGVVDPALGDRADLGELDAVVDAERERRVAEDVRRDDAAPRAQDGQHVGQVELALCVVGLELLERLAQRVAVEGEDRAVDLADLELGGRRVARRLRLDDALDGSRLVAHHAAVAGRVVEQHRRHRRGSALPGVRPYERRDRLAGHERRVARQDDDRRAGRNGRPARAAPRP